MWKGWQIGRKIGWERMMFLHFLEFDGEVGGRQTHEVDCQQQQPNSNFVIFDLTIR